MLDKFSGILKSALVVSPVNDLNEVLDIDIKNGIIAQIGKDLDGENEIDMSGKIIMPAFVEMHCHLREPGYEEKETIESGVASAIAGGYSAICPMANTKPVNDSVEILKYIKNKQNKIDVLPICAVTKGLCGDELVDFNELKDNGAIGFSNDGRPLEDMKVLKEALIKAEQIDALVISHAEDTAYEPQDPKSEYSAVLRELDVVKETDARYHFAHISTKESVELIREAKAEGWNVTCETAPHYFILSKEDIIASAGVKPDGVDECQRQKAQLNIGDVEISDFNRSKFDNHARFKMNPPLREKEDVQAIIDGLLDGTIDVIATDHAPHTYEEKNMSFEKAPMGIVGFETAFSLAYKAFIKTGYMTLPSLVKKFSLNPSAILNLENHGKIEAGMLANLAIFDPSQEWTVEAKNFKTKCKITPFEGMKLKGKIIGTIAKGNKYEH